jgi:hypothetical protein
VTSILLRHASAGHRDDWDGDDWQRPLDARGSRQAGELVELLRPFGVTRVLSSPYVRCVATVEPLAAALGLPVEQDDRLAEGAGAAPLEFLNEDGCLSCTHGDVIYEALGYDLKKGEAVVLADGAVVGRIKAL